MLYNKNIMPLLALRLPRFFLMQKTTRTVLFTAHCSLFHTETVLCVYFSRWRRLLKLVKRSWLSVLV